MKRPALAAAVLALAAAGCSPASPTLITAGSQTVTVADFDRAAQQAAGQFLGTPDLAKAQLVDELRRRALLLEYVHRLGEDTTASITAPMADEERRMLIQSVLASIAPQGQRVSEAEARAMYDARHEEAHLHMIYSSSHDAALAATRRLRAGEPFDRVAADFNLLGVVKPDGDEGWVAPGALPDPLDGALRTLPLGEAGGPYEAREGWFVLMVSERREREQPPYETLRAGMFDLVRQRKFRAAFNRAYLDLKQEHGVRLVPGGSQVLFRLLSPLEHLAPTPELRRTPLAEYGGRFYTVDDAYADLQRPENQMPPTQLLPAIEIWIEAQVMTRVVEDEARRRHLHEDVDAVTNMRNRREQALLQRGFYMATEAAEPAGPDQVAMAWERVRGQFSRLESVTLAVLSSPDSALVHEAARGAAPGRSLAEVARALPGAPALVEQVVHFPTQDPEWAIYENALAQQPVGMWIGPSPTPQGWRLLQVVDKRLFQPRWEDLPEGTRQNIASSANEMARMQRYREFTDSLATAYMARVDQAQQARLRWPDPSSPLGPPGR